MFNGGVLQPISVAETEIHHSVITVVRKLPINIAYVCMNISIWFWYTRWLRSLGARTTHAGNDLWIMLNRGLPGEVKMA